ncbi:McrC family protein [Psychrobacter frigidicola]|nr:McrC family protein [Psychrobacter frigidicola]
MSTLESPIITVFEHQRLTVNDFVYATDFAWLVAQEFAVFSIKRQRGQWQLKVGHYIGLIILPSSMTLEILPKAIAGTQNYSQSQTKSISQRDDISLTRQWVQQMLTDLTSGFSNNNGKLPHTRNLGQLSPDLEPLPKQTPPLSQWLVEKFVQLLASYQPSSHYQTQIRNQSMLQGKLLLKEQLRRNHHQPHKFISEVSTLSKDMLSNRFIKSALLLIKPLLEPLLPTPLVSKSLLAWRQVSALSHHELRQLTPLYLAARRQLSTQPLSRQQLQSAQQLVDVAYWLLQGQQASVSVGNGLNTQAPLASVAPLRLCLLINMNQAFEQWASQRITELFNQRDENSEPLYRTLCQPRDIWLRDDTGQTCLSVQPDLLVYYLDAEPAPAKNNVVSHVIDIKWKHLSQAAAISASDAYQLTSYAQAYQAEQVWLIYPVTGSTRQPVMLKPVEKNHYDNQNNQYAGLWLMPFNVLTGKLNRGLSIERENKDSNGTKVVILK